MAMPKIAPTLVLLLLSGCFVTREERPSQYAPPQDEPTVVVTPDVEEVNDVVYREYFVYTDAEIAYFPHYRRYYGLTDDDIYFLSFTSRQCGVSFDVCFHSYYYDCDRNYDRLVLFYHVPRERYFVVIGADVSPPPMYARAYASYRGGSTAHVAFSNQEYTALVHMKVGVEYQGRPPGEYFSRVQATGSTSRVIVESRDQSGRGGRTATGAKVAATAPRPWTMPPDQKQQWHQERQASSARTEIPFKEVHREQVSKVEKQQPAKRDAEHRPAQDNPPPNRVPHDAERKPPQKRTPPKEEEQDPPDPKQKHPGPDREEHRRADQPPPKTPPPPPHEKHKGDDKDDKKDKEDRRES